MQSGGGRGRPRSQQKVESIVLAKFDGQRGSVLLLFRHQEINSRIETSVSSTLPSVSSTLPLRHSDHRDNDLSAGPNAHSQLLDRLATALTGAALASVCVLAATASLRN